MKVDVSKARTNLKRSLSFGAIALSCLGLLIEGLDAQTPVAKNIEYISTTAAETLIKKFQSGRSPQRTELAGLELVCDMYGLQSRLQAEKGIRLYKFSSTSNSGHTNLSDSDRWLNSGAQITKNYENSPSGLRGSKGSLSDELRKVSNTEWVSQLSYQKEPGSPAKVIAMSLCRSASSKSSPIVQSQSPLKKANL